ncbi:MAG TPA: hypothetical protein VHD33_06065 [Legionellaceae bacterium]|nr:hypothetical protein [Legionellaceae bacterium]
MKRSYGANPPEDKEYQIGKTVEEINMINNSGLEPINYDELDPGVRQLVKNLRSFYFETTDSGDGVTKYPEDRVLGDQAHIFIQVKDAYYNLTSDAHRLNGFMQAETYFCPEYAGWKIEASYDPENGIGILMLTWPHSLPKGKE